MSPSRRAKARIAADLLEYLVENPSAQDTLEGIVEWWLLDRHIAHETALLQQVLNELTEQGLIVKRMGTNARAHYRINPERYDDIRNSLGRAPRDK